jgi:hypothetical protein
MAEPTHCGSGKDLGATATAAPTRPTLSRTPAGRRGRARTRSQSLRGRRLPASRGLAAGCTRRGKTAHSSQRLGREPVSSVVDGAVVCGRRSRCGWRERWQRDAARPRPVLQVRERLRWSASRRASVGRAGAVRLATPRGGRGAGISGRGAGISGAARATFRQRIVNSYATGESGYSADNGLRRKPRKTGLSTLGPAGLEPATYGL